MAVWSYNPSLATAKDRVRFYAGDTIQSQAFVYDEEILGMLLLTPNELLCAAEICDSQAAQASQKVDYSIGGGSAIRINLSQRAAAFAARAKALRQRSALRSSSVFAGGISHASKQTQDEDPDRVRPVFTKDDQDEWRMTRHFYD